MYPLPVSAGQIGGGKTNEILAESQSNLWDLCTYIYNSERTLYGVTKWVFVCVCVCVCKVFAIRIILNDRLSGKYNVLTMFRKTFERERSKI